MARRRDCIRNVVELQIEKHAEAMGDELLNDAWSRCGEKLFSHLQPTHGRIQPSREIERGRCVRKIERDDDARLVRRHLLSEPSA